MTSTNQNLLNEDQEFMEIVDRGTSKINDHYVVPLPFCDPNLMLPNNKKHAIQRLMGLKRRFMKDNKFFQDYVSFMDNLLRGGYAKRSDASPAGKTWYIPHHGVYHPSKPGKIRVVFAVRNSKEDPSTKSCCQDQI